MNAATNTAELHPVRIDRTTRATMRDGVELGIVIARPDAPGRFPAIMSYNPYRTLTAVKSDHSDTHPGRGVLPGGPGRGSRGGDREERYLAGRFGEVVTD